MKVFADNNLRVINMIEFVLNRVENTVGKEKMLVTIIFLFHNVFRRNRVENIAGKGENAG